MSDTDTRVSNRTGTGAASPGIAFRLTIDRPTGLLHSTPQASFISLLLPSHMLQGGGSLSGPPAHVRATGHPLLPGTAPLLGRGLLTCTLQGPFHLHTWTLAMKTPALEAPRRRARVQIVHAAGRRCGALEARRTGAASL